MAEFSIVPNTSAASTTPISLGEVSRPNGLALTQLESHLWEAANILRGPVDAADFKTYIFPLLFFKRISDVYDEEFAQALADSSGDKDYAAFPENHRFQIPDGCHWRDVRERAENVGQALQHALREVEQANPATLFGIFGDAQWANKERFSDALLHDLMDHFAKLPLGNDAVRTDLLGQAYEYLIKKFADATNNKAGEFYTPRTVVRLMVNILNPQEGDTIYDPACGTGGMLLEATNHIREAGGNVRLLWGKLFGQEKNLTTSSIARMNLFLHGVEDFQVVRGDTLRQPAFFSGDRLAQFDCVIANPPFSLEKWGEDAWATDPYGRNVAGVPPSKSGDYAWVQHMITSMAPVTGRVAVVLPHGALFRMGVEGKIRRRILDDDLLEAVLGLGPNLFYGTGLAACILIFRRRKFAERKHRVLIIDGSKEFRKGRNQNTLEPEHVDRLFQLYRDYVDVPGMAHVATMEEIAGHDYNLNISLYVEPLATEETVTVNQAVANLKDALKEAYAAEDKLRSLLVEAGLHS